MTEDEQIAEIEKMINSIENQIVKLNVEKEKISNRKNEICNTPFEITLADLDEIVIRFKDKQYQPNYMSGVFDFYEELVKIKEKQCG
jgi:exonuclease VII small subunit